MMLAINSDDTGVCSIIKYFYYVVYYFIDFMLKLFKGEIMYTKEQFVFAVKLF